MPLAIDLFCGLGGWTDGLLAEGYDVVGFDIERRPYPAQLVIQDILTIDGSRFRNADLIVASPPCQNYSYMAMPWSLAKKRVDYYQADPARLEELNALFNACFRIQREASAAAGRHIPLVVENVCGAQRWVGRAKAHYGSYYLWGDIGSVGGAIVGPDPRFGERLVAHNTTSGQGNNPDGRKVAGFRFDGSGGSFQSASVLASKQATGRKSPKDNGRALLWKDRNISRYAHPTPEEMERQGFQSASVKQGGNSRAHASAMIAKIPLSLARFVARIYGGSR